MENIDFSTKNAGIIGYSHKNINLDSYPISYTKINSKWPRDLNVRAKLCILEEEKLERVFETLD